MASESKVTPSPPSLAPLRIAAALGIAVALVIIVVGFSVGALWGVIAIILAPVLPLAFVLATDRLRKP